MSQYFFAVHDGQFGKKIKGGRAAADRRGKIARKSIRLPVTHAEKPFDGASAIESAWEEAGL